MISARGLPHWRSITVTCPVTSLLGRLRKQWFSSAPGFRLPRRPVVSFRQRQSQAPPDKGGWNAFFGFLDRSIPNINPYGNRVIRSHGLAAWDNWPTSPRVEALRAASLDAGDLDSQRWICAALQMQLWQDVRYIPMGEYWQVTKCYSWYFCVTVLL